MDQLSLAKGAIVVVLGDKYHVQCFVRVLGEINVITFTRQGKFSMKMTVQTVKVMMSKQKSRSITNTFTEKNTF